MQRLGWLLLLLLLAGGCTPGVGLPAESWLAAPGAVIDPASAAPIAQADIYEVVDSTAAWAVDLLAEASVYPLTADLAPRFAGSHFTPVEGKNPYLVRAVYGSGATGIYDVARIGDDLWITHRSMSHSSATTRSALVLNLDFVPQQVYVEVAIAE